jgi:hypothetical protein
VLFAPYHGAGDDDDDTVVVVVVAAVVAAAAAGKDTVVDDAAAVVAWKEEPLLCGTRWTEAAAAEPVVAVKSFVVPSLKSKWEALVVVPLMLNDGRECRPR